LEWVLGRTPYQLHATRDDFHDPVEPIIIEAEISAITNADKRYLMSVATSQQQRGALTGRDDPIIKLKLTIPPFETPPGSGPDDEPTEETTASSNRATFELNLWGFPIHRGAVDRRRQIAQLVVVATDRRPSEDLQASRWTPYGQLMKTVLETSPHYDELKTMLDQVNSKIQEIFSAEKASLLRGARIPSYVDDVDFQLTRENNPAELLRYLEVFISESERRSNISQVGTGMQSAVIIGMFELVLRQKTTHLRIFVVEEPDAFIHPHGIRLLAGLMRDISQDEGPQVLLTSHSPALVAGLPPRDIIRVEKQQGTTDVFQAKGDLSDPDFARFVNQDTAEMFFARRVVLVEGDTERFLLPPLSRLVNVRARQLDFDRDRISVIPMHTKDNIVNFLRILDEFQIEARAILDNDFLSGTSRLPLVAYLRGRGMAIDDASDESLRGSLWNLGILVLQRGEIENYVPESDVAAITGKSISDVRNELASSSKASMAFKRLFNASKPVYALQLTEHYISAGSTPADLERLIKDVVK